jgi:spore maturation protein CgeB
MKFLILVEDYTLYYTRALEQGKIYAASSFANTIDKLMQLNFYQGDSMGSALINEGQSCEYLIPFCYPLQKRWAKENDLVLDRKWRMGRLQRSLQARLLSDFNAESRLAEETLIAQVKKSKPDVIYVNSGLDLSNETLTKLKSYSGKMILQWSCPIPESWKKFGFQFFDLICTSSLNLKSYFQALNYPVYHLQQAFDERVLQKITQNHQKIGDVVFIGSLNREYHPLRIEILSFLNKHIGLDIYCPEEFESDLQDLTRRRKGNVGGMEMYQAYAKYRVAIHVPGNEYLEDAGAKRLFEVTGIGTLLLTYRQANLSDYFEDGREIITFATASECLEKIQYLLKNAAELESISKAGQERTLRAHTFTQRAQALLLEMKSL